MAATAAAAQPAAAASSRLGSVGCSLGSAQPAPAGATAAKGSRRPTPPWADSAWCRGGSLAVPRRRHCRFSSPSTRPAVCCSQPPKKAGTQDRSPVVQFQKLLRPAVRILGGADLRECEGNASKRSHARAELARQVLRFLRAAPDELAAASKRESWPVKAESDFLQFHAALAKYTIVCSGTGAVLSAALELAGGGPHQGAVLWFSWLAGLFLGSMIGTGQVMESYGRTGPRNVVVTGSTRGLGKALAREFLRAGDNVVVASRDGLAVAQTVSDLQEDMISQRRRLPLGVVHSRGGSEELTCRTTSLPGGSASAVQKDQTGSQKIVGMACNVHFPEDVKALVDVAVHELGTIDVWINNAGVSVKAKPFLDFSDMELNKVVSTNLLGSLSCTKAAILQMKRQSRGGHVFNMDGNGSGGQATPRYAAYGATKCALRQFHATLLEECRRSRVGVHTASPGMVLTDLLLSGATLQNKQAFNIICEQPETVARALVPRMRNVRGTGKAINYLTPPRIILAIVTAWLRRGRWFDEEGQAVYAAEADRLRMWAEGEQQSPVSAAMEMMPSGAWVSLFSSTVICAYLVFSNVVGG
eukprot:SM000057S18427  [mRNA]  locus=s57:581288:584463:- [translate_table: standard]